jgi:PGF-CTERM protein
MLIVLITGATLTATPAAAAQYIVDGTITVQEPARVAVPTTLSCHITYKTSVDYPNLVPHPAPSQTVQFFVDGIAVGQSVTNENGYAEIPYTFATPGAHTVRAYSATTIVYDSMNAAAGRWSVDVTRSITVLQSSSSPSPSPFNPQTTSSLWPSPSVSELPRGITVPGFEGIIAVIGIVAVAYLLRRNRDNSKK